MDAYEEALVNAVYHRDYEIREPIEVRITSKNICIVSHPGPDMSISAGDIKTGRMLSRRYRNRRIGEFLKELDFTEGRGTGLPKMRRVLKANGSEEPVFYTDEGRLSFWVEIKIHPEFLVEREQALTQVKPHEAQVEAQVEAYVEAQVKETALDLTETELKILMICEQKPSSNSEILEALGYKSLTGNVKNALKHLKGIDAIEYTVPNKPRSRNQKYRLSLYGKEILKLR